MFVDHLSQNVIQDVFIETPDWSYFDLVQSSRDNFPYNPSEDLFEELSRTITTKYFHEQNGNIMPIPLSAKKMDQDDIGKVNIIKTAIEPFPVNFLIYSHPDHISNLYHNLIQSTKSDFYIILGYNILEEKIRNNILDQIIEREDTDLLQHISACSDCKEEDVCECPNSSKGISFNHSHIENLDIPYANDCSNFEPTPYQNDGLVSMKLLDYFPYQEFRKKEDLSPNSYASMNLSYLNPSIIIEKEDLCSYHA